MFSKFLLLFMYFIQHCFICRPSDSTVPTDAGIEPRTVSTGAYGYILSSFGSGTCSTSEAGAPDTDTCCQARAPDMESDPCCQARAPDQSDPCCQDKTACQATCLSKEAGSGCCHPDRGAESTTIEKKGECSGPCHTSTPGSKGHTHC